jgi:adenosylcobyric acid synthase
MIVVGDIDRGGVFAALYGTWALLDEPDRKSITAFVINKFRGDLGVLRPGLDELTRMTDVPVAGVLPWLPDLWLDAEDSLELGHWRRWRAHPAALRVAAVRLPRISNATDVDALAAEPGVDVVVTSDPGLVADADLAVLPGSRATVSDLHWLRTRGLADALAERAGRGAPVLGICGGYQILGNVIMDELESGTGLQPGLDLLPIRVSFGENKVLGTPSGSWRGAPVTAYEIHHGVAEIVGEVEPFLDGCRVGSVWGTMWHGAFENDDFRRAWLAEIAGAAGSAWQPSPLATPYRSRREAMIDILADAVEQHLDLDLILTGTRVAGR